MVQHYSKVLDWMVTNKEKLLDHGVKAESINQLLKCASISHDGWAKIPYFQKKFQIPGSTDFELTGRRYAFLAVGLQNLSRKIRQSLIKGQCCELDMVNAHPTIAEKILQDMGITQSAFTEYKNHRNDFLKEVMDDNLWPRDKAKDLFISIMNLGTKLYKEQITPSDFSTRLLADVEKVVNEVVRKHPEIYKRCLQKNQEKFDRQMAAWLSHHHP